MKMYIYIYHMKSNKKKVGVAVLICKQAYFKTRNITKDKDGHYIIF